MKDVGEEIERLPPKEGKKDDKVEESTKIPTSK